MFVSKINGLTNIGFKGYQHVKNNVGETVMKFNYPYDYDKETCEVQFFKVKPTDKYNYKIDESKPIYTVNLKPEGVNVNLQTVTGLDKDEAFAYKIVRKDKQSGQVLYEGPDTGVKVKPQDGEFRFRVHQNPAWKQMDKTDADGNVVKDKNGNPVKLDYPSSDYDKDLISNYKYTIVTRYGTTPMVQGAAYLAMPDSFKPGAMYRGFNEDNTGEIYYDKDYQKKMEGVTRNFSNMYNGSIAGLQDAIPYLKENGYKILFSTPIANGDDVASHSYWNKNNMQLASKMGTTENYASFMRDLFKNGMKYVYDGTFTSEGLEGIHFQYALKWAEKNPQTYYWFRMSDIKNSNVGLGVIPKNKENLRHRLVNAPYKYELQSNGTYKEIPNDDYKKDKPTYVQIYDALQTTDEQASKLDENIRQYEKLEKENTLNINSHDDTLISFVLPVRNFDEYRARINVINDLNKNGQKIELNSPEGSIMAIQFPNFKIGTKTDGGIFTWDANTDMVKMNYHISGYDEKILQGITNKDERYSEQQNIIRGTYEVQDLTMQAMRYWTANTRNIQEIYTAQTLGKAKTVDAINKLIEEGKLPKEAAVDSETLNNILNAQYILKPKGVLDKDSVTLKSILELPLDSLEFSEDTVGVLSTSYFSNRATKEEQVGLTRFELMQQDNPHLVEPYAKNYKKVDLIFKNEIKSFAESVVKKLNETSDEKLLDSNGNYTEYGEYVLEHVGKDIAKYAFLKSLAGESFKTKILPNGEITYDYQEIKSNTSLKSLGINAHSPEDEARQLTEKISKGLKALNENDITYLADAISKRIAGTDVTSFRLAEALVEKATIGLDWRLDACKDVMDQDAVRNESDSFDDTFNNLIKFWKKAVQVIKAENPHSYIVAEMTDIPDLMKDTYGLDSCPYNGETDMGGRFNGEPDAMAKFFNETGITTEAGYSYFFTNLLHVFSPDFENGALNGGYAGLDYERHDSFKERMDLLMQTRSVDYMRNLYTFMGNHDKPRLIHGLALDMGLFHANLLNDYKNFAENRDKREDVIKVLSGTDSAKDVPIELRLNVDNNEYFKTISSRAVAQSKVLLDALNNDLDGVASKDDIDHIKNAIIELTRNGASGIVYDTMESKLGEIIKMAENHGLHLSETEKNVLIKNIIDMANSRDINNYLVHGDFDWTDIDNKIKEKNLAAARDILGNKSDYNSYSLYTIQLAKLLKDSLIDTKPSESIKNAMNAAFRDFAEKYNKAEVSNLQDGKFRRVVDYNTAMRENKFAALDFKTAIKTAIEQAETKTGKTIANKEEIIERVFRSATEPAVAKAAMIMEYFNALFGLPTMYAGDEFGMSGYEEKAKNIWLQNRNAVVWSEKDKRQDIINAMNEPLKARSDKDLHALNNGTPYSLDVCTNSKTRDEVMARIAEITKQLESNPANKAELIEERRILTKDLAKIAYMMHSANGDMTVSIFNAGDIEHGNREDYFKKYSIEDEAKRKKFFEENNITSINPNNRYVPIQPKSELDYIVLSSAIALPLGTIFMNANSNDKAKYVVKELNGKKVIAKEGGKIIMDGLTAKNGVMILKHIKNLVFKGSKHRTYFNPQYNFVTNPYSKPETVEEGQKLSLIAR